jgi:hypothetical protein
MTKAEPWYLHAALYAVIVVLIIILIKVAILDPKEVVEQEKYYRTESRLRMKNLKEAEILWEHKYGSFTDNLDSLIHFVKNDPMVDSVVNATDSITKKSSNPFIPLYKGEFIVDSLFKTPKSQQPYIVHIDTTTNVDTVVNRQGKLLRIDSTLVIGSIYYIEDPDGYGSVGSLDNQALKNTVSWE